MDRYSTGVRLMEADERLFKITRLVNIAEYSRHSCEF